MSSVNLESERLPSDITASYHVRKTEMTAVNRTICKKLYSFVQTHFHVYGFTVPRHRNSQCHERLIIRAERQVRSVCSELGGP